MTSVRTLNPVITSRVDPANSERLFSESRQLGNPLMCPAGAMNPNIDQYFRPQGGAGFRLIKTTDSSCGRFLYPVKDRLIHENADRPHIYPCNADHDTGDTLLGSVRNNTEMNIYDSKDPRDINYVSHYNNRKHIQKLNRNSLNNTAYNKNITRKNTMSHNALRDRYYG